MFENIEALATGGELELKVPYTRADTASARLEREGTAYLAQHGADADGRPLDEDGKPVTSADIMSCGKRVNVVRAKRPNGGEIRESSDDALSYAAQTGGMRLYADPVTEIDAKRRHRVELQHFYICMTQPCKSDACRYARIDAGLRLLADAQSDYERSVILGAVRRDCKILGIATPTELAGVMGCSTSTCYARMRDGSLEAAIVAVAAERSQTVAETRRARNLQPDIRRATKGTVFDSPAWHREIEHLFTSLKYEIINALARETTLSRLDAQKGSDRALRMIPHSRIEQLAELKLLSPDVCRKLGQMSEEDRDEWIAERDTEDLAELFGNADQRRKAADKRSSSEHVKRIKEHLRRNGRNPNGPILTRPNEPARRGDSKKRKQAAA